LILEHLRHKGMRSVCLREVQNSIKDSVHQLVSDWLEKLSVGPEFDVLRDEIKAPGGGAILFRGMKDQNAESIKSLEGVRIAWFEEAQTCSAKSLQLLRPTIREPGSELWFTWNPRKRTDPVDAFLRGSKPSDAVVVRANYFDNPFFPDVLERERQHDLEHAEPERYRHVWLGDYEAVSSMQFIAGPLVAEARVRPVQAFRSDETVLGVDVARFGDDRSVIQWRRGRDARSFPPEVFSGLDTMQFAAKVADTWMRHRPDAVFIDEGGVGGGVVDRLRQLGFKPTPVNFGAKPDGLTRERVANKRAEMWARMREWLAGGSIADSDDLENELTGPEYRYDADNRIILEKKEDMKKRGLLSPDRADALALTLAYPVAMVSEDDDTFTNWERRDEGRSLAGY
jgi:Phage terminase large subunit